MQNYLALHRHAAVRTKLLGHPGVALRLCVAQIVAGSSLFQCRAEPQKAATEQIAESLEANKTMESFNAERKGVRELIGWEEDGDETLVSLRPDWQQEDRFDALLVRLLELDDEAVMRVFTFAVSETLPSASGAVEILGAQLSVDMGEVWEPDAVFLDLLRDKEAINAILSEVGGKQAADAHVASTAKVQKGVIAQYLDGTRQPQQENWLPRYMRFPMEAYTGRGGIEAIEQYHEALQPSE
jgi:ParB family chromosome partitioning protein